MKISHILTEVFNTPKSSMDKQAMQEEVLVILEKEGIEPKRMPGHQEGFSAEAAFPSYQAASRAALKIAMLLELRDWQWGQRDVIGLNPTWFKVGIDTNCEVTGSILCKNGKTPVVSVNFEESMR